MDFRRVCGTSREVKCAQQDRPRLQASTSPRSRHAETQKYCHGSASSYLMYSEKKHSLLIVLQALDAAGKDGTVNHVMAAMNPQGTLVTGFKAPTPKIWSMTFCGGFILMLRPRERLPSSTARTMKMCWWCECISWRRKRSGRNGTNLSMTSRICCDAEQHAYHQVLPAHQQGRATGAIQAAPRRSRPQLENQRRRLQGTRAMGRLHEGLRRRVRGEPATKKRRGTSFRRTTNGFATWRCRRSSPPPWKTWA